MSTLAFLLAAPLTLAPSVRWQHVRGSSPSSVLSISAVSSPPPPSPPSSPPPPSPPPSPTPPTQPPDSMTSSASFVLPSPSRILPARASAAPATAALDELDALWLHLHAAVLAEDYGRAVTVRNAIERARLHALAARAKPRFAPGLVVHCSGDVPRGGCSADGMRAALVPTASSTHGYRAVVLSADVEVPNPDYYSTAAGEAAAAAVASSEPVVWYRAAVDVRDRARLGLRGGNVRLIREDMLMPVRAVGTVVQEESRMWETRSVQMRNRAAAAAAKEIVDCDSGVQHPVVGTVFEDQLQISEDGFQFYRRRF